MNYVRVYDFNKEIHHLRKLHNEAKKFNVGSNRCIDNVKENIQLEGEITSVEGEPSGKLGFPTFTMCSNGKFSSWERKSHMTLLDNYPNDKLFKPGKKIKLTYGIEKNENKEVSEGFNTKWVLYIDIEE